MAWNELEEGSGQRNDRMPGQPFSLANLREVVTARNAALSARSGGVISALVRYDEMCRAIDVAYKVDEAKDIRDKAVAMESYFRQAKNTEAERRACEIRLRAERKGGELLKQIEKSNRPAQRA